eukprot:XP_001704362.1 Hypothetical protein GL50803_34436 [Giardia lamblia ATCC 50803]
MWRTFCFRAADLEGVLGVQIALTRSQELNGLKVTHGTGVHKGDTPLAVRSTRLKVKKNLYNGLVIVVCSKNERGRPSNRHRSHLESHIHVELLLKGGELSYSLIISHLCC